MADVDGEEILGAGIGALSGLNDVDVYNGGEVHDLHTAAVLDTTLPLVGNFVPAEGTILSSTSSITFDVTDDSGAFARVLVVAIFAATGIQEVVHDGENFVGFYGGTSSRSIITDGFRYTVTRYGGWTSAPSIRVYALDRAGNEAI